MKLFESIEKKINTNKYSERAPHLEINDVVSVHCNIVNNVYRRDSRVLYIFVSNKSFVQLLDISPKNVIFLETFNSDLSYIEVWFIKNLNR